MSRFERQMKIYAWTIWLLTILSCSTKLDGQTDTERTTSRNVEQTETVDTIMTNANDITSVLYKSETFHNFSSPSQKDSFRIYVTGKSISEGEVTFQIVSYSNEILLEQKFPSSYLIGYGLVSKQNPTEKEKEDYIKKRIDDFFVEDNFENPAIAKDKKFDEDHSIKESWDDIKSDETAIGFRYLVGEENGEQIAYSKRRKVVVSYYWCC